jgi:ATP-binding cassette subfamily B protein
MKAKIDDYILSLPKGYDTPLTRDLDGIEPSGGQKQRIAIARTLFKTAQIILLDEPTSNVDPKTEEEIFANIIDSTQKQIVLLVSHRFSTVRKADRIILLDEGEISETGSHQELIDKNGKYARLFNLQAKSYQ